jgi:hypothetical protein
LNGFDSVGASITVVLERLASRPKSLSAGYSLPRGRTPPGSVVITT